MEMRGIIKTQLGLLDPGEFGGTVVPDIMVRDVNNGFWNEGICS